MYVKTDVKCNFNSKFVKTKTKTKKISHGLHKNIKKEILEN